MLAANVASELDEEVSVGGFLQRKFFQEPSNFEANRD
jgi:hypothetical protein